jgi:hypothetical protein
MVTFVKSVMENGCGLLRKNTLTTRKREELHMVSILITLKLLNVQKKTEMTLQTKKLNACFMELTMRTTAFIIQ